MNFNPLLEVVVCLSILCTTIAEALLCVQCESRDDRVAGDCEHRPGQPTPCLNSDNKVYCRTVREIDMAGTQIGYIRTCSPTASGGNGEETCKVVEENPKPGKPAKLCYQTCDSDGCNHSPINKAVIHWALGLPLLVIAYILS